MEGQNQSIPLLESIWHNANQIVGAKGFPPSHKRVCVDLIRRVKLILPFLEEVRESQPSLLQEASISAFYALEKALCSALRLLQFCKDGSKLYLVLERVIIANRFYAVTDAMDKALDQMPTKCLELSLEVQEQFELVHAQLKRAKGRSDTQDMELFMDAMLAISEKDDTKALCQLAEKLQLKSPSQLKSEAHAVQNLIKERNGVVDESLKQILGLLRRLTLLINEADTELDSLELEKLSFYDVADGENPQSPVVPNDFRCPISLELMKDPVIVATGQTYERSSIQKWLEGHKTCPKTGEVLPHTVLTPNFALRSLIIEWCEANGIEVPKRACLNRGNKTSLVLSSKDGIALDMLLEHLCSGQLELQRVAAEEIRSLAKQNADNRVCIAEAGAIPLLVNLLSTEDHRTQEHAVTALLNLSIYEGNKRAIVRAGAIPHIVGVLKNGNMEARENAAATLFSLSVMDENKMMIGAAGAIPPLVDLLRDGNPQGRKDAATALFNLAIYQGNKRRAIRAGIIDPLMRLMVDLTAGMRDEALAILAILVTHQEGRVAIGNASAVPVLVDIIKNGSSRNKENAASVLLALSSSDINHLMEAQELGVEGPLIELVHSGTARARRKASSLLERLNKQNEDLRSP